MKRRIDLLAALDRNSVPGTSVAPVRLRNLVGARRGGYVPFGKLVETSDGEAGTVAPGVLVGTDSEGGATFIGAQKYYVALDGALTYENGEGSVNTRPWTGIHLPSVGAYSNVVSMLVENTDGAWVKKPSSGGSVALALSSTPYWGQLPFGAVAVLALSYVETKLGKVVLHAETAWVDVLSHQGKVQIVATPSGDLHPTTSTISPVTEIYASWGVERYHLDALAAMPFTLVERPTSLDINGDYVVNLNAPVTGISVGAFGRFMLPSLEPPATVHQGRVWSRVAASTTAASVVGMDKADIPTGESVLVYSEPGYVNLFAPDSWIELEARRGGEITALLSTPSGLLVFFENEAQVLVGQGAGPYYPRPFLGGVGCDDGTLPTQLMGVVYVIWQGQLYAIRGGSAEAVGFPVWLPEEQFTSVAADPVNRSILLVTKKGRVLRYEPDRDYWSDHLADAVQIVDGGVFPGPGVDEPEATLIALPAASANGARIMKYDSTARADAALVGSATLFNEQVDNEQFVDPVQADAKRRDLLPVDIYDDDLASCFALFNAMEERDSGVLGEAPRDGTEMLAWTPWKAGSAGPGAYALEQNFDKNAGPPTFMANIKAGWPGVACLSQGNGKTPQYFTMQQALAKAMLQDSTDALLVVWAGIAWGGQPILFGLDSGGTAGDELRLSFMGVTVDGVQYDRVQVSWLDALGTSYTQTGPSFRKGQRGRALAVLFNRRSAAAGKMDVSFQVQPGAISTTTGLAEYETVPDAHASAITGVALKPGQVDDGGLLTHFFGVWNVPASVATPSLTPVDTLLTALVGRVENQPDS